MGSTVLDGGSDRSFTGMGGEKWTRKVSLVTSTRMARRSSRMVM